MPAHRILFRLVCVLLGGFAISVASAADPQPYEVVLESTGLPALDETLRSSALLVTLKETSPVPPFGLITRATGDIERLKTALNSFGYYQPRISMTVAGLDLADPMLPARLDATPAGTPVTVNVGIDRGPLYHLRRIAIEGPLPPALRDVVGLSPGDAAVAAEIVGAQARLLSALQEAGHAFADVGEPIAYADDAAHAIDVAFAVNPGPVVEIGGIRFEGLRRVNEDFVRRAFTVRPGARYSPSAIDAARQALIQTGVFQGVSVRAADRPSDDGRIAITVEVEERPLRAVSISGTYSTDLGVNLSASWTHRNLFGNAEQLSLSGAGTGLWGNATEDIGYEFAAQFFKPLFLRADQRLELGLSAVQQDLRAYRQRAETASARLRRQFSSLWSGTAGLTAMSSVVSQKGVTSTYQLLGVPVTAAYDGTGLDNPLLDAVSGSRASFGITPTLTFGARTSNFLILQAAASTYFNLSGDGRSVLALRGLIGSVQGASNLDLPPDQRLYAGGSATVRGFRFQSIGPLFPDGDPVGGTAVDAASIELRQRLFGNFGAVLFVDAGQASAENVPFTGTLRYGAGTGIRYYSPIGVVRADIAVPLNRPPGGDAFQIYIGFGQAF